MIFDVCACRASAMQAKHLFGSHTVICANNGYRTIKNIKQWQVQSCWRNICVQTSTATTTTTTLMTMSGWVAECFVYAIPSRSNCMANARVKWLKNLTRRKQRWCHDTHNLPRFLAGPHCSCVCMPRGGLPLSLLVDIMVGCHVRSCCEFVYLNVLYTSSIFPFLNCGWTRQRWHSLVTTIVAIRLLLALITNQIRLNVWWTGQRPARRNIPFACIPRVQRCRIIIMRNLEVFFLLGTKCNQHTETNNKKCFHRNV